MSHTLGIDSSRSVRTWNSKPLEPGTPYESTPVEEARYNRIQPFHALSEIAVHRLPVEIWEAVCEALRQLDLLDSINQQEPGRKEYPELRRTSTNKNRPDPIITARSILRLSQTCRFFYKVTSPSLLKNIRLRPLSSVSGKQSGYLSVIRQAKCLHLNSDQRLQKVRGFAVDIPPQFSSRHGEMVYKMDLRNQIRILLTRLTNLRHLTLIGMALDFPLMQKILTLQLEHFWVWSGGLNGPLAYRTLVMAAEPRIKLRSLVVFESSWETEVSVPDNWMSQFIGPTMQELALDGSLLNPSNLPVIPNLEFLEVPDTLSTRFITPGRLSGLLSKTPNLKEVALEHKVTSEYQPNAFPTLSQLQRVVCHSSWLQYLIPRRPIKTAKVLYDSQIPVKELSEILHEGSVPLRNLDLTYSIEWPRGELKPDDLEPFARYFPELETLRLRLHETQIANLEQAMIHVARLDKLRLVWFGFPPNSGSPSDAWQGRKLKEFLGITKSPFLESISFVEESEWRLEMAGVWKLREGGKLVRSVLL